MSTVTLTHGESLTVFTVLVLPVLTSVTLPLTPSQYQTACDTAALAVRAAASPASHFESACRQRLPVPLPVAVVDYAID